MILPTIGRVVWFQLREVWDNDDWYVLPKPPMPLAAIITGIITPRLVNLVVFNMIGVPRGFQSVTLLQDDETMFAEDYNYCEWMPYQKGQAAKTEALEKQVGA